MGGLGGIVLSWVLSPLLSGLIASSTYYVSKRFLIKSSSPRIRSIFALPFLYAISMFCLLMMVFLKSKAIKTKIDLWLKLTCAAVGAILVFVIVRFGLQNWIVSELPSETGQTEMYLETTS